MLCWGGASSTKLCATRTANEDQQDGSGKDYLFGNKTSRKACNAFRKLLALVDGDGPVIDEINVYSMMTASSDAIKSTAHQLTSKNQYNERNKEQHRDQRTSDDAPGHELNGGSMKPPSKKYNWSPWMEGNHVYLKLGRLYRSYLALGCTQFLSPALFIVYAPLLEQYLILYHD